MDFLKKLFNIGGGSKKTKNELKLTPKVLAARERIEARKEQEDKEQEDAIRRERLMGGQQSKVRSRSKKITIDEEIRRLERRAERAHNDKLTANSTMDFWHSTIAREDPPDTIFPDMVIPDASSEVDVDKLEK